MDGRNRIYDRISQNYPDVCLQMLGDLLYLCKQYD